MNSPMSAQTEALIALGSNLGDSQHIIEEAFIRLQNFSAAPIRRSSLWRSAPVDCPPGSTEFVNAVGVLIPLKGETPESLLAKLQALEIEFGRRPKSVMNEPRRLDLDLIAFGNEVRSTSQMTLPHPRAHLRQFVLEPLREVAPQVVLPGQTRTVEQLSAELQPTTSISRLTHPFVVLRKSQPVG